MVKSRWIIKVEPSEPVDRSSIGCERKKQHQGLTSSFQPKQPESYSCYFQLGVDQVFDGRSDLCLRRITHISSSPAQKPPMTSHLNHKSPNPNNGLHRPIGPCFYLSDLIQLSTFTPLQPHWTSCSSQAHQASSCFSSAHLMFPLYEMLFSQDVNRAHSLTFAQI